LYVENTLNALFECQIYQFEFDIDYACCYTSMLYRIIRYYFRAMCSVPDVCYIFDNMNIT